MGKIAWCPRDEPLMLSLSATPTPTWEPTFPSNAVAHTQLIEILINVKINQQICELASLGNLFSMLVKPELINDNPPNVMRFHLLTFSEFYIAFLRGIESPRWIQDLFTFFSCLGNSSRNSHHLADGE